MHLFAMDDSFCRIWQKVRKLGDIDSVAGFKSDKIEKCIPRFLYAWLPLSDAPPLTFQDSLIYCQRVLICILQCAMTSFECKKRIKILLFNPKPPKISFFSLNFSPKS